MSEAQETYFRMCWMTLKANGSAKLRGQMDKIEISLCGLAPKRTEAAVQVTAKIPRPENDIRPV